eukprot:4007234-Heterocapsa_arctica.AAC.1
MLSYIPWYVTESAVCYGLICALLILYGMCTALPCEAAAACIADEGACEETEVDAEAESLNDVLGCGSMTLCASRLKVVLAYTKRVFARQHVCEHMWTLSGEEPDAPPPQPADGEAGEEHAMRNDAVSLTRLIAEYEADDGKDT